MFRSRRVYRLCYFLMLLGLGMLYFFLPGLLPEPSPQEEWSRFQEWIGPPPQELQAETWNCGQDEYPGEIFTFKASEEWRAEIADRFSMAAGRSNTQALPPHRQELLSPGLPLLTAYRKLTITHSGNPGYDVKDMTLALLNDGRTLLAFRACPADTFANRSCIPPAYEPGKGYDFPTWYVVTCSLATVAFILLVPLGFLLLFPSFNLKQKRHTACWFATALLYPIGLACLTLPFLASGSEALIAFIAILFILVPLQLIGALVLYLITRSILSMQK